MTQQKRLGIDRETLIRRLAELALPAGDWALHGSGPMLAHGLLQEIHDIDIVARGAAWEAATRLGRPARAIADLCVLLPGGIEIYDGWMGDDVNRLIDEAEFVAGLPCVQLERVLDYKRRLGRAKDIPHIALLEALTSGRRRLRPARTDRTKPIDAPDR